MNTRIKLIARIIFLNLFTPKRALNMHGSFFSKNDSEKVNFGPVTVDIEPTIACNLNCIMCHRKELAAKCERMTMDFAQFKKILDKLPTVLKLNLQGMGEPLLAADFFKMVRYAKKRGIVVTTVTNGMLVSDKKAQEIVSSKLDRIYFSIDNVDGERYKKYRVGGEIEQVKLNLKRLVEEKKKQKNKSLSIGIWMLIFNDNADQIIPMLKLAKKLGVDEVVIQTEISYRGKENWKEAIHKIEANKNSALLLEIKRAQTEAKNLKIKLRVHSGGGIMKPTPESRCMWPWKSLYVNVEGNVSPCCIIADTKVACMGNILNEEFNEIWNGKPYFELRKSLIEEKIPDYCKGCYKNCEKKL